MEISGLIYKITNNITNKCYIGQTRTHYKRLDKIIETGIQHRWKQHKSKAKQCKTEDVKKQCRFLNSAINKYGSDNFNIEEVHKCDLKDIDYWEDYFIKKYNTLAPNGYNLREGGMSGSPSDELRKHLSRKTKEFYSNNENKLLQSNRISETQINDMIKKLKKVELINVKICPNYIYGEKRRVNILAKTSNKIIKCHFGGIHLDFNKAFENAVKVAEAIIDKDKITISDKIYGAYISDDYQNKINNIRSENVIKLTISIEKHLSYKRIKLIILTNYNTYTLYYGNVIIPLHDAYKSAHLFASKVINENTNVRDKFLNAN